MVQTHSWTSAACPSLSRGNFLAGTCRLQDRLPVGVTAVLPSPPSAPPSRFRQQRQLTHGAPLRSRFHTQLFPGLSKGRAGDAPRSCRCLGVLTGSGGGVRPQASPSPPRSSGLQGACFVNANISREKRHFSRATTWADDQVWSLRSHLHRARATGTGF